MDNVMSCKSCNSCYSKVTLSKSDIYTQLYAGICLLPIIRVHKKPRGTTSLSGLKNGSNFQTLNVYIMYTHPTWASPVLKYGLINGYFVVSG